MQFNCIERCQLNSLTRVATSTFLAGYAGQGRMCLKLANIWHRHKNEIVHQLAIYEELHVRTCPNTPRPVAETVPPTKRALPENMHICAINTSAPNQKRASRKFAHLRNFSQCRYAVVCVTCGMQIKFRMHHLQIFISKSGIDTGHTKTPKCNPPPMLRPFARVNNLAVNQWTYAIYNWRCAKQYIARNVLIICISNIIDAAAGWVTPLFQVIYYLLKNVNFTWTYA